MFTKTNTIKFMSQSENSKKLKTPINEDLKKFLWGLSSTIIIACFVFAWNTNGAMAQKKEHDTIMDKKMDDFMLKMDNIQLDLRDVRERVVRIEAKQNTKQ